MMGKVGDAGNEGEMLGDEKWGMRGGMRRGGEGGKHLTSEYMSSLLATRADVQAQYCLYYLR